MRRVLIYATSILIGIIVISIIVYNILDILLDFELIENTTTIIIRDILFEFLWCIQSLIIIVILIMIVVYLIKKSIIESKKLFIS
ncbi:MAG TPA: hypothetical protein PKV66_03405 [Candidatus Pelethenecus sp.]|nr:hypothetical protein [Candidatus Pelethenecus sp.]